MLAFHDLQDFFNLPSEFNSDGMAEIKTALQEFQDYKSNVVYWLYYFGGEDGFKNPLTYSTVEEHIKTMHFNNVVQQKFFVILNLMRQKYVPDHF